MAPIKTITILDYSYEVVETHLLGCHSIISGHRKGAFVLDCELAEDKVHYQRFCQFCDKWHRFFGPTDGPHVPVCDTENNPLRRKNHILRRVDKIVVPEQRYPIKVTRYGRKVATCPVELLKAAE